MKDSTSYLSCFFTIVSKQNFNRKKFQVTVKKETLMVAINLKALTYLISKRDKENAQYILQYKLTLTVKKN